MAMIEPRLPNKPRGVPRVNDRKVLNGIFWVLRSGAPWRDVPDRYGPYTTCYNRFRRWTISGIWDSLMEAITGSPTGSVKMIDGTSARVHQSVATLRASHPDRCLGPSRGGLTTKIHALTDGCGLPVKITITPWQAHDITAAEDLINCVADGDMLLGDKAYDADWLRTATRNRGAWATFRPNPTATTLLSLALGSTKGVTTSTASSISSNAPAGSQHGMRSSAQLSWQWPS